MGILFVVILLIALAYTFLAKCRSDQEYIDLYFRYTKCKDAHQKLLDSTVEVSGESRYDTALRHIRIGNVFDEWEQHTRQHEGMGEGEW